MSNESFYPMHVSVVVQDASQLRMVYAVLAGSLGANLIPGSHVELKAAPTARVDNHDTSETETVAPANLVPASDPVTSDDSVLDAHGHPWSAELHASTKAQTGAGLWRMKPGASRPDPKPGFPKEAGGTGTVTTGEASSLSGTAASADAGQDDDDDEFAAFRAAADKADANDTAAAASVPARKWTDADLGALCNQAATKLGDPAPIRALISQFMPEGEVPHSRKIADADREKFAKALEAKAGIEFAG